MASKAQGDVDVIVESPPQWPKHDLPDELKFLLADDCNPDLKDKKVREQGYMRGKALDTDDEEDHKPGGRCEGLRILCGLFVYSVIFQSVVLLIILFDVTCTIIEFADKDIEDDHALFTITDWSVVTVLSADVLARFFVEGLAFLRGCLNVFELVLVPVTIGEVFLLKNSSVPVPLLRALRPILRGLRILRILVRTAGKGRDYLVHLKHSVSGDRVRFQQDGFDLDLAYIGAQIIAMPVPGVGLQSMFFNSHQDVARFLNERHGNKYLLLNTTDEMKYPTKPFFNRILQFPISQDSVPAVDKLFDLCKSLDEFLKCDPEHILVIHSKHGQGRVSIVIIALLLYQGAFQTVEQAVFYVEHNRLPADHSGASTQTLDSASQRRFLGYFAHRCQFKTEGHEKMIRPARLRRIVVQGLPNVNQVYLSCFRHPQQIAAEKKMSLGRTQTSKGKPRCDSMAFYDEIEEDMESQVLQMPEDSVAEMLRKVLEEGSFDSPLAGCRELTGPTEFTSKDGDSDKISSRTLEAASDPSQPTPPGVWEITNVELSGEIRLEIHRTLTEEGKHKLEKMRTKEVKPPGLLSRICGYVSLVIVLIKLAPCCFCFRSSKRKKDSKFEGGLLFATWLHTGFLELDEPPQDSRQKPTKTVRVMLDRFGLDKATQAPSLRSQSTALQVILEFEVDHRVEWKELNEMMHGHGNLALASGRDMSESETLRWLTFVSEKIWPSFEKGFSKLVSDMLEPLKDTLPPPFKNIQLEQFSLGPEFPKFGPISASSRDHEGLEVQLDIFLHYETYTNIVINLGLASVGISYLRLSGMLCLKFKPIIDELPVFTAMQLLFLNTPKIELKFAKGLEIANLSMVHEFIHSSIDNAIADLMVLPNIINISWGDPDSDSTVSFQNVLPASVVRIGIVEGRDLQTEQSILKRPPDSHCKMHLGSQQMRTRTIAKANNPVWGAEFDVLVHDDRQQLVGNVYDIDFTGRNKAIGAFPPLTIAEIVDAGEGGKWVELTHTPNNAHSQVLIRAFHFDLRVDKNRLHELLGQQETSLHRHSISDSLVPADPCSIGDETIQNGTSSPATKDESLGMISDIMRSVSSAMVGSTVESSPESSLPWSRKMSEEELILDEEEVSPGEGCSISEKPKPRQHAGAVALMICHIPGGHVPKELTEQRGQVELRIHTDVAVKLGKKKIVSKCAEPQAPDPGTISEKTAKAIERLADQGLKADEIAHALDEDEVEVHRIIRRRGWNVAFPQKTCIFLHEADLMHAQHIAISLHLKKKTIATGSVPLSRVLNHFNLKHSEVVKLKAPKGHMTVDLDAEFRIYTMVQAGGGESSRSPRSPPLPRQGRQDSQDSKESIMCSI